MRDGWQPSPTGQRPALPGRTQIDFDSCSFVLIETRSAPALTHARPHIRPSGFPIYVARRPAAPFTRCYPRSFTFYVGNPFPRFVVNELRRALNEGTLRAFPLC